MLFDLRRERDERGAVGIVLALVFCFVAIPLAALVVDLGAQRVSRSDAQSVADVVALDMARQLGRQNGTPPTSALALQHARKMGDRAGDGLRVTARTGYIDPSTTAFSSDQHRGCDYLYSGTTQPDSAFTGTAGDKTLGYDATYFQRPGTRTPNAVLVTVVTTTKFNLAPGSSGRVCQSAIASPYPNIPFVIVPPTPTPTPTPSSTPTPTVTKPVACYDVGSFAAGVSTGSSALLNPLLQQTAMQLGAFSDGGAVRLLDYRGLASAQLDLGTLATKLGVGSVRNLATATVTLQNLYGAARSALLVPDPTVDAMLARLQQLALPGKSVDMRALLKVGTEEPIGAHLSALDLVGGSLMALNGTNFVSVNVGAQLPGLLNSNAQVKLIQGPHRFCGSVGDTGVTATDPSLTEQLRVSLTGQLQPSTQVVSVPAVAGLASGSASVNLANNADITVSVAPVSTTLKAASCGPPASAQVGLRNGLASVTVRTPLSDVQLRTKILGIETIVRVNMTVEATARITRTGEVVWSVTVPPQQFDKAYPAPGSGITVSPAIATNASVSGGVQVPLVGYVGIGLSDVPLIAQAVADAAVRPLLDATNPTGLMQTTINPVLRLLGVEVAGADVSLASVTCPSTSSPSATPTPTPTPTPSPSASPTPTPSPTRAPYLRG